MRKSANAAVEANVSYITRTPSKPFAYEYDPPAGTPLRSAAYREHRVQIRNARLLSPAPTLDKQGFALARHPTRVRDFYDAAEVRSIYYPEVEQLVKEATGANSVVIFDHTVRGDTVSNRSGTSIHEPVNRVHNDYTAESAVKRVRDVAPPDDVDRLLKYRIAEFNVWRPIRGPLRTMPLAMLDAASLQEEDFVACDLIYRDRLGEIYYVAHRPEHEWYYYPDMERDEALLLKCFDSDIGRTRFGAHAAFKHPQTPADAPPRESIEVRAFAFFAPPATPHYQASLIQIR
jgi:hypothetical protein